MILLAWKDSTVLYFILKMCISRVPEWKFDYYCILIQVNEKAQNFSDEG